MFLSESPVISNNSQRPNDLTRDRLLRSAGPVFADRGYDGATVREICGIANVNIASVGYYFGDKLGLYREVIREIQNDKTRRFPIPDVLTHADPTQRLFAFVRTLLKRMLEDGEDGWQVRLLMREMEQPTEALDTIVLNHFMPVFEQLCSTLAQIIPHEIEAIPLEHLALSVIGQCLHYRVSRQAISRLLSPSSERMSINELAVHITSVTLAAANSNFTQQQDKLRQLLLEYQKHQ